MNKVFSIILLLFYTTLLGQEPLLGILKSVNSNTQQLFLISNNTFICESYGVLSLENLAEDSQLDSACRKKVKSFYKKNPKEKYFSALKLHTMQTYHLEFKKQECLLFASGEITLSELLLREGLAILQPLFKDKEYIALYSLAQENAKIEQKGLWREGVVKMYKK
jgi:nuclease-like protein